MIKRLTLAALAAFCVTNAEAWFFCGPCNPCYIEYVPVYRPVVYRHHVVCRPSRYDARDAAIGLGMASVFCGIAAACCAASR